MDRSQRHTVYGDMDSSYSWTLTDAGKKNPYDAITLLFVAQQPHKRTLLHCDYLISLVNFRSLADAVGKDEFNKRIAAAGADKIVLRFSAFQDLHKTIWEAVGAKTTTRPGLGSTQQAVPSSEGDLVIGDHVVFFNHMAYDLINWGVGNAWRLENAVLIRRERRGDVFLGHGSGEKTGTEMRAKLAEEFNEVANRALALTRVAASTDKAKAAEARNTLAGRSVVERAGDWRIVGTGQLCATAKVDMKLRTIRPDDVIGLKDPCDATKLYRVERPIESAKGTP
jgi:hypothetical protein